MIQWLLVTTAELALCEAQHGRRETKRNPRTQGTENRNPRTQGTEDWRLLRASGSFFTEVSFDGGGRYTCMGSSRWIVLRDERGWYDVV
jgi:hypothetical protein